MSVNSSQLLDELYDEPYGPYLETEALTEACKSVPTKVLGLTNFMLECGGSPIGLDQSEKWQPEYQDARVEKHGVRFRGVLAIETLEWLQPLARKKIKEDIRHRHVTISHKENSRVPRESETPSLEYLYLNSRRKHRLKIVIQGVKNLPALYLRGYLPNGLLITSELGPRQVRRFQYLGRYRTLAILERILHIDKDNRDARGEERPNKERTPQWFAMMYKKHIASAAMARKHRIVWTSSDSDIADGTEGQMKNGREHVLRHVPTAEVLSLLATHAEWILDEQRLRKKKFLDMDVWGEWVRTSRKGRIDAWKNSVSWGWFDDVDPNGPIESDDEIIEPARQQAKKKAKAKARQKQIQPATARFEQPLFYPEEDEDVDQGNIYDPDFSPPSSPPASDWDSDDSLLSSTSAPDPAIVSLIPIALYYPPMLPDSSFIWVCPVKHCGHELSLLELSDEDYSCLSARDVQAFRRGGWNLSEHWVQAAFMQLVSKHYDDHLARLGIVLQRHGRKATFVWKDLKHHPALPTRNHYPIVRRNSDEVKVEQE
ncbi:hypothetical protein DAEQUDRAFT_814482 [Daedalea quercina L-15889]|uniref:Uncharacterized protein n=1 Tax=Daedalea quercina L-15889 TaxID=1314783 RepID=A0A165M247_9APHY|nr:hypothetical protein DAEQUDRAFT_814482 [Daedalea quercina L-15889]